ncbi:MULTISPECIES: DUF2267 domain-containing protein [Streptomyces]|uniref:DUF2267 domain-containing protein n=2 Tax=Streptomyces TaxID=1883 RepID=A0A117IXF7_9ACTN|nr:MULTISPECIES: DUF2267 domain-containing protein [Streptomyces]KUH40595.1 hypothetical protein ATE80_01620 [Streptomyces kanasensis]UUS33620.1 DUF2267 domain-containing protein [Streptomyces changanensis]
MRQDEFLARVCERGEYRGPDEAARITAAVLEVLGHRVAPEDAAALAALLPGDLGAPLAVDGARTGAARTDGPRSDGNGGADGPAERFGVEEFHRRVDERTGVRPRTAQWDAAAVLGTLAEVLPGDELDRITGRLPREFAALFRGATPPD